MSEFDDKSVPIRRRDPMLEETNVLRLEGRYFSFATRAIAHRAGQIKYRDGDRETIIEVSDRYGHPGPLAYRVLQAVFRKSTLHGVPDSVGFGYRELGRMIGRDIFGGADSKQLFRAIKQLEETGVTLVAHEPDAKFRSLSMKLIVSSYFVGAGEVNAPSRVEAVQVMLHPFILAGLRENRFAMFNWPKIESLEPIACALYKRLFLHFSNLFERAHSRESLSFEKDYAAICGEWLGGLRVERYISDAARQVKPTIEAVRATKLIRSGEVVKRSGDGFKIVFKPGEGFFEDYELLYKQRAESKPRPRDTVSGAVDLVRHFYELLNGPQPSGQVYTSGDTAFASELIGAIGEDGAKALAAFAVHEAPKTGFDMRNIRAMASYRPAWEARRAKDSQRLEASQVKAEQRQVDDQRAAFEAHCRAVAMRQFDRLPAEQQDEIRKLARDRVQAEGGGVYPALVKRAELRIVQERFGSMTFEQWVRGQ